jgi:hypothetical protein
MQVGVLRDLIGVSSRLGDWMANSCKSDVEEQRQGVERKKDVAEAPRGVGGWR